MAAGDRLAVRYLVSGVLAWLELGDPAGDDEFIERATEGMFAMFLSWADSSRVDARRRSEAPTSTS